METYHLTAGARSATLEEICSQASSYFGRPAPRVLPPAQFAELDAADVARAAALETGQIFFPYPSGKLAKAVMSSAASCSMASTVGNRRPSMAAITRSCSRTWAGAGWAKMVRMVAATISAEPLGT